MENPIGIIGAMDVEVELLKESMAAEGAVETSHTGQLSFFTGTLSGTPVVVAQCDVGMVNAAAHTQLLIDRFAVRGVVNTGVAGSLDASIDIGDIVVATDAVNHLMDVGNLGYAPGQTPGLSTLAFPADEALRRAAVDAAASSTSKPGKAAWPRAMSSCARTLTKTALPTRLTRAAARWKARRLPRSAG